MAALSVSQAEAAISNEHSISGEAVAANLVGGLALNLTSD